MRLLIDANILLDVLQDRLPFVRESALIWKLCETSQDTGILSVLTYTDLMYIMRKQLAPDKIEDMSKKITLIFHLTELSVSDIEKAAAMKWDDFEDALQAVTAERLRADYIITRNTNDFRNSKVPSLTPIDYLKQRKF